MAHLFISAAHKSSGKTSVTIGLAAALVKRGVLVQPFKKGPDYIDPLWLARAAGRPCFNLDFHTQTHAEIRALFAAGTASADIGLIEGNKGLFDGMDTLGTDSNAALAALLSAPTVLVIDAGGITRGIAPLMRGYLDFDPAVDIRGVILNKVAGARHEAKLRGALERYTDARVIGVLGRNAALEIPERHLGLIPANEASGDVAAATMVERLAAAVTAGVDVDHLTGIAASAKLPATKPAVAPAAPAPPDVRIAIARDAAFGFYYPDDLDAFAAAGAELAPFDTLSDPGLPTADGLFIGGGFPETQMARLSGNRRLLADIRQALADGMPAYAECGGLMYLARSIHWRGEKYPMAGVVPADIVVGERPRGRGYMVVEETAAHPWAPLPNSGRGKPTGRPAHEFHYAGVENLAPDARFAHRVLRGSGIDGAHDGLVVGRLLAGFSHHRNTGANPWVRRFVDYVRANRR